MAKLIVGFDSAWAGHGAGAVVACLLVEDGSIVVLGDPQPADFVRAQQLIRRWQVTHDPATTLILVDQPTIVNNATGQRAVENIVSSVVCRRRGAMQPSNRAKVKMFGDAAPIWSFLATFGGAIEPELIENVSGVIETYPVLALIALGAVVPIAGPVPRYRLPKYNPQRRATFALADWALVCNAVADALGHVGADAAAGWARTAASALHPTKMMQDQVDACLCLVAALHLARMRPSLCVGDRSGFIIVPYSESVVEELKVRCIATGRTPAGCMRRVH